MNDLIRKMVRTDKEEVLKMMEVFYASEAVLSNGSKEIFNNDLTTATSDSPYLEGYIFEENKIVIGYSLVAKSFSTEYGVPCVWIEDLYFKEEYRGKGIGSSFFRYLKDKYFNCLLKLEVEEENKKAIKMYQKNNFKVLPYLEMIYINNEKE